MQSLQHFQEKLLLQLKQLKQLFHLRQVVLPAQDLVCYKCLKQIVHHQLCQIHYLILLILDLVLSQMIATEAIKESVPSTKKYQVGWICSCMLSEVSGKKLTLFSDNFLTAQYRPERVICYVRSMGLVNFAYGVNPPNPHWSWQCCPWIWKCLPLYKVADTPLHIQGGDVIWSLPRHFCKFWFHSLH